jgi:hypothetical protein
MVRAMSSYRIVCPFLSDVVHSRPTLLWLPLLTVAVALLPGLATGWTIPAVQQPTCGSMYHARVPLLGLYGPAARLPIDSACRERRRWTLASTNNAGGGGDKEVNEDPYRGVPSSVAPSSSGGSGSGNNNRALDPLVRAVTRSDGPASTTASSVSIPVLGSLELDRSLFLLVPLIGFAVGGILLSLYILVNSGDAIVQSVAESTATRATTTIDSGAACRGLCSSQQQDLEGLRTYMNNLGK